ncbi:glycoside hydrolase family 3 C-terminal domain-containing protein [Niabella pedocola]|uniref:Glycoside hydrolase family 3 C-terminal domain-containing protein n=1 Tax=Niabella pedocola TaxID=1752077 RepID=A0ABS8PVX7_9BACT|nr:glycoside hydrolase family 3 N-terminal domain-containing protein [Niabella pedocola]MCD2425221.1 glycoside hydrolase family 3 C-terminal domain-containing protein [Niabella pedocola]
MKKYIVIFCSLFSTMGYAQTDHIEKAKALASRMTLEEKVNLVRGQGFKMPGQQSAGANIGVTKDKVPGAAGITYAIPRLGIPTLVLADGPAGVRIDPVRNGDASKTYYATAFPIGSLLASTWDTELIEKLGAAFGSEARDYGIDILLAPAMNLQRNPLGGRNFEYYSEDPLVSGRIAAAMVNGIQSRGVGTSIKHFAANNQEFNRMTVNEHISERALRELYLKGFEIAVKTARPWTVMSSYNKINGTYASESYDLLTTVLRKEWGFEGLVMTDWFGGQDAAAQMKAGNDLLMPGTPDQTQALLAAVKNGSLPMKVLDENVVRILQVLLQAPSFKKLPYSDAPDLKAHAAISRAAAADGMVLLKNEQAALPLTSGNTVALFGNAAYSLIAGGTGSGDVNKAYTVSLHEGLQRARYKTDQALQDLYSAYIKTESAKRPKKSFIEEFINPTPPIPEPEMDAALIAAKAATCDIAVLTIGRQAGENNDRHIEGDFDLSPGERLLLKNIAAAFHARNKKVVVVLNTGGVMETASWSADADALLLAWQPGQEGGNAIADILSGAVNPSGKLAVSFPVRYADVPGANGFPGRAFPEQSRTGLFGMKLIPAEADYEEDIYVGYRYYQTFGIKPAYAFGFGLSYTSFSFTRLELSSETFDKEITVSVTVTNTGKAAGREVVQLYLAAPAGGMNKPRSELKAFAKTRLLQPGETQILQLVLDAGSLASFDEKRSAWVAAAGTYEVKLGNASDAATLSRQFRLPAALVAAQCTPVLTPSKPLNLLKPANNR